MKQEKKLQGKVGIMGGTFDPIHIGHLILAEQACAQFKLDRILFMPTSHPPHKDGQAVTEAALRRDMVLAAIRGNGKFLYSDMELKREGVTYTSDTLAQLKEEYPNTEFYFIMGADSLFTVDTWHKPQEIFDRAVVLAANRMDMPGDQLHEQIDYLRERFGGRIGLIEMPDIAVSSRQVRRLCAQGKPFRYFVPEAVYDYILEHCLYRAEEPQEEEEEDEGVMKPDRLMIKEKLRHKLGIGRFEHTMGVAYTAACLAMRYGADMEDAELAGLLHDCAKQYDNETLLKRAAKYGLQVSDAERRNPSLLHAKVGAYLAEHKYDVEKQEILDAIRFHTTGRPGMSLLEKIVYVADYIEPRRFKAPNLKKIRELAFLDLDRTVYEIMWDTLEYLKTAPGSIDDTTKAACDYYRALYEAARRNEHEPA